MADAVLGLRRSILLGSLFLACAYLLIMLSGYTIPSHGDHLFIIAYALVPAANSLLMGTASAMVSRIYTDDAIQAKTAMTYYYMAINVGALCATWLAPVLLNSRYGPLSVFALTFMGKAMAALNFAYRYTLYDNVTEKRDQLPLSRISIVKLIGYLATIYAFSLCAYAHIVFANWVITFGCIFGIIWFLIQTYTLSGTSRYKQAIAGLLIIEAIVFFVIYNQTNSTLVLFAQHNSNAKMLGLTMSPAQYQMLNPLLILLIGLQLPRFYRMFPRFSIPYQFACGTIIAGSALLILAAGATHATDGMINGNWIALTYILITLAELWVSAIGLSMIGLYCNNQALGFAMGTWYLGCSLSNTLSGRIAQWVAIPNTITSATARLSIYQHYYHHMGATACLLGGIMLLTAYYIQRGFNQRGLILA